MKRKGLNANLLLWLSRKRPLPGRFSRAPSKVCLRSVLSQLFAASITPQPLVVQEENAATFTLKVHPQGSASRFAELDRRGSRLYWFRRLVMRGRRCGCWCRRGRQDRNVFGLVMEEGSRIDHRRCWCAGNFKELVTDRGSIGLMFRRLSDLRPVRVWMLSSNRLYWNLLVSSSVGLRTCPWFGCCRVTSCAGICWFRRPSDFKAYPVVRTLSSNKLCRNLLVSSSVGFLRPVRGSDVVEQQAVLELADFVVRRILRPVRGSDVVEQQAVPELAGFVVCRI
ncbi:hypothetical protein BC938DRAFT_475140 [Jimgerdemannia flammicorona]|uniref:Uncharacterized protein n=1 Tax=Jimgerdemannia flammicorona TaxID=994334 RepID=A0A433PZW7_9FUNG|nr:hypothetical protein BC938DRAFT_475140 [Jimgerdemannia flammicorona]